MKDLENAFNTNYPSPTRTPTATRLKLPPVNLFIPGPIPSFKTGKRGAIVKTASGKLYARPVTDRDDKKRMTEIIRVIECQLRSAWQQAEALTPTGNSLRSWIASCVLLNDSAAWIRALEVEVEDVNTSAGAHIRITLL